MNKHLVGGLFSDNLAYLASSIFQNAVLFNENYSASTAPILRCQIQQGVEVKVSVCVAEWEKLQILLTSYYKDLLFFLISGQVGLG